MTKGKFILLALWLLAGWQYGLEILYYESDINGRRGALCAVNDKWCTMFLHHYQSLIF